MRRIIIGRITAKAQTTIPLAVRRALGLAPGDDIEWDIQGDRVVLTSVRRDDGPFMSNFDTFTEWASEADCKAVDRLLQPVQVRRCGVGALPVRGGTAPT